MYQILMDGKNMGTADVNKEGLYYKFSCLCVPPDDKIYRIILRDGNGTRNLGVCVPDGKKYMLNVRIPVKKINGNQFEFFMVSKINDAIEKPVETGKTFPYLDKLENAILQTENGKQVIVINQYQVQPDNDQNQECPNESE